MKKQDIIIVGAGLSGLGCAKRLSENKIPFKIITENIGGRVKTSPDGEINYGAYYITADCHNVLSYVEKIDLVHFGKAHFHKDGKHYHAYSLRMVKHIPAGIRLLIELFKFRRHVQRVRKSAKDISYQELIEADPYLKELYHQKAGDYIKKHGLEKLTREYLEQFLWAAFFTDPRNVSATVFLGVLLTVIVPSYSFKFNFEKLTSPFKGDIILGSIIKITRSEKKFRLESKSGEVYQCDILVLATPMDVANNLLSHVVKPQKIKGGINVNYYHLQGKLKKPYDVSWYNFFPIEEGAVISRERDGSYLYFYGERDNVSKYFDNWEVIAHDKWEPALFFYGDQYIDSNPLPNVFLANDHDVPSTEDAFINGHYTAKLILELLNKQT